MYSDAVSALARRRTSYIDKETFLLAFKIAFERAIIENNISVGFRGASLVPHDPNTIISKLDVRV